MHNHNTFIRKQLLGGTARHDTWGTVQLLSRWENDRQNSIIRVRIDTGEVRYADPNRIAREKL
jgi:hypothetical protein